MHSEIVIQQDGARCHIADDNAEFANAAAVGGWKIRMLTQPARSPDVNVLDLGFFRALQTNYWGIGFARNVDELVANVHKAFADYDAMTLDRIWVTAASVLDHIIMCNGGNDYKIPHLGKAKLERQGKLPVTLEVSDRAREIILMRYQGLEEESEESSVDTAEFLQDREASSAQPIPEPEGGSVLAGKVVQRSCQLSAGKIDRAIGVPGIIRYVWSGKV